MSDKKIPPEGARWEDENWTPDHADDEGKITTYIERLANSEKLNEDQASEIEQLKKQLADFEAQKADFDTIRAGRDAKVLSLAEERDALEKRNHDLRIARDKSKQINVDWDKAYKELEGTYNTAKQTHSAYQNKMRREIFNHRLIIGGMGLVAVLLTWALISNVGEKSELEESNAKLTKSNETYAADQKSTAELRDEIATLTSQRDIARADANSLRSNLNQTQNRARQASERAAKAEQRGNLPGGASAYPRIRVVFLNYINGLSSRFPVDGEYVSCIRGGVLDELERAYSQRSSSSRAWSYLKDSTKGKFAQCRSKIKPYNKRSAVHGDILNDYMYKQNNFLDRVRRDFGG